MGEGRLHSWFRSWMNLTTRCILTHFMNNYLNVSISKSVCFRVSNFDVNDRHMGNQKCEKYSQLMRCLWAAQSCFSIRISGYKTVKCLEDYREGMWLKKRRTSSFMTDRIQDRNYGRYRHEPPPKSSFRSGKLANFRGSANSRTLRAFFFEQLENFRFHSLNKFASLRSW